MSKGLTKYLTYALLAVALALLPVILYVRLEAWELTLLVAFAALFGLVVPYWFWWYRRQAALKQQKNPPNHANTRR